MTMTELCLELKNFFVLDPEMDIVEDTYEIVNGSITPAPSLNEGDYFRIVGSRRNDGVYRYSSVDLSGLVDEKFTGALWIMSVPPAVEALLEDISAWEAGTAAARNSPYQSESFGGYSYSLKSGGSAAAGGASALSWQGAFAERLKPYRRLVVLI